MLGSLQSALAQLSKIIHISEEPLTIGKSGDSKMKTGIIAYLLLLLTGAAGIFIYPAICELPSWLAPFSLLYFCGGAGLIGGITYCLRAVYLNSCVRGTWDEKWGIWYFLRPVVSLITGFVSYIFLKAGLLVLDASTPPDSVNYGFLALAFIAGLNVDKFLNRIESIAESSWGIDKSNVAKEKGKNED